MPRTLRKRTAPRRAERSTKNDFKPAFDSEGSVKVDPMSKHDLILAHRAARVAQRASGKWTYYVGVAASVMIVFTGWWLTFDTNVRTGFHPNAPGLLSDLNDAVKRVDQAHPIALPSDEEAAEKAIDDPRIRDLQKQWAQMMAEQQRQETLTTATTTKR